MGVLDHDNGLWRIMIQFGTMVRSGSWSMALIKQISRIMIMDHMSSRGLDHDHGSWSYGPYHPKFLACGWLTVDCDTMTTFFGMRHGQIKNDFSLLLSVFCSIILILILRISSTAAHQKREHFFWVQRKTSRPFLNTTKRKQISETPTVGEHKPIYSLSARSMTSFV